MHDLSIPLRGAQTPRYFASNQLSASLLWGSCSIGMYVCMYVCMYVSLYVCMYLCMYACMHVCMCNVCYLILRPTGGG
jgi:hypothetical protein